MRVLLILILSSLLPFQGIAQNKQTNKQKFIEDYAIFQNIFEQANAGLYKYHTKKEIDRIFSANKKRINDNTSLRDFYNIVWDVVDYTGSCHNNLSFSKSYKTELNKREVFFPIPLRYSNGKLYSISENAQISFGSQIVSINKIDACTFAKNISKYLSTDGHNVTGKYAFLNTNWLATYIYLAYGEQQHFVIEYLKDNKKQTVTLAAVNHKTTVENFKNRFVPNYEQEQRKTDYSFQYIDKHTALLAVNTFVLGGPKSEGHKKYAAFLDAVFIDLKKQHIDNLIVDVRRNGGGNDPNDLLLYSYLTKRNFRENTTAHTRFNTVPLAQYFIEEDTDEIKDLEEELREEHSIFKDDNYYQNPSFNKVWEPNPNAFQGKTYLLISPFVASAGSLFAALLRSDAESVVIGQESLGGYYGHTGHVPVSYKLPHSELELTFSIVDLEQDVRKIPNHTYGDGVKPDYEIESTIEDYLHNKDTVLDFTKQLIQKK